MTPPDEEEPDLQSTALRNVKSIVQARQRAEEELIQARESLEARAQQLARMVGMLRATLDSTTDAILVTGPAGEVVDVNEEFASLWALGDEELARTDAPPWPAIARQLTDEPRFLARLAAIEGSTADTFDQLELVDGRVVELFSRSQSVGDAAAGRVWSFRDVTVRKMHEAALQASHAQFFALLHHSPVGVLLLGPQLEVILVNPSAQPVFGDADALVGRPLSDVLAALWTDEFAADALECARRTLASGEACVRSGSLIQSKDGRAAAHYDWQIHRVTLPDGQRGVACYFVDVSDHVRAQQALRDSEERVRATFEQAAIGMAVADLDCRMTQVNRRFAEITGYAVDELLDRSLLDVTHAADVPRSREQIARLLSGERAHFALEKRYVRKDGEPVWCLTTVALLRDAAGEPERFVAVVEDVTERKRAAEREREIAQRLQLALTAGGLGDWSWDAANDAVTLGPRAAAIFGLQPNATITWAAMRELLHPEDRERARLAVETAIRTRGDYDVEYRLQRSGAEVWIAAKGRSVHAADGATVGMIGVVQDVTERKRLEIARERLAAVVESSDDAIVSKDLEGTILTWNPGAERVFGYTAEEMIGASVLRLIPEDLHAEEHGILERLRHGERIDHYETVRVTKDGWRIDVSLTVSPVRDAAGRIVGASKVARDVTARKQLDAQLRRKEEELRALADSIPQLAWIARADGSSQWFNRGWYEYTGTTLEQVEGWGWESVHDERTLPRVLDAWRESLRTGGAFEMEFPLRGKDGEFRWFLTRVRPIHDPSGRVTRWFGTSTDIDELKRAREALWDESRLLNLINETGKSIATGLDLPTLVQKVTDAATQLSGAELGAFFYNSQEEGDESFQLFTLSGADREQFERFGNPRATPLLAPTFKGESAIRSDDILADERYGQWGGMPAGHLPVRSYMAVPVVARGGDVIGGLFFGHSRVGVFTERIERVVVGIAAQAAVAFDNARLYEGARRASEERRQLLEAERSARAEVERVSFMKDEFLATLSHELRTPLNAIVGWSQVLRMRDDIDAATLEGVTVIERNAKVQAQLIEDLLDMSRIVSGKVRLDVQQVDLHDVVSAALASVHHSADSKHIRVQSVIDPLAGPVWGDPNRLQQCFWNLLTNAIKFTPKGGTLRIRVARIASHVEFSVADDGQGIAPEFLPHVFERFRQADASTTRRYGGLGLGLSIVKSLVELHGGSVRAHSEGVGRGSRFVIELPVMGVGESSLGRGRAPSASATTVKSDHPSLQGVTVLAVDDEPDARTLIKRVLEDCGARVFVADSARHGLEVLEREHPDVLISDIGMPEEDGYDLIRSVRKLDSAHGGRTPAAALSAFARPEDRTRALRAGYQTHLAKPVEPVELTAVVASLAMRQQP